MTLGKIPILLEKIGKENINRQILRTGILAELDAINLYEQMAAMTDDKNIKAVLMDIAKEEKEHVGEFQYLLLKHDKQQEEELQDGMEEVKELLGE
ncbi:MAG: rubrerythrin [Promethearchaeota archaeon]|nr:MAG: rubrerythrin [Candidatus Lokiarchaeota archaeon]